MFWRKIHVSDPPVGALLHSVALDRRERTSEAFIYVCMAVTGNDLSFARHQVDQTLEGDLYRIQIFVNVGMIEFHGGENNGLGKIMEKLGAFIEESSIVFVALQNEMFSLLQGKAAAKIFRNASNQK